MTERKSHRAIGTEQEKIAASFLADHGYRILEQNFRCRQGEIDLIAEKEEILIFVEVKYRSSTRAGLPEEAVNLRKQQRIYRSAQYYMLSHGISPERVCRFDVISIYGPEIRHLKDAFGGM